MESTIRTNSNPLAMFMRQPKIFIRLPSNGEFWPEGSIDLSENGEYPVFSMTAHDELLLKIPDALMNGQAVVDVIQHCMPNIKNAWHTPSIDVDMILIAIRLASYGEKMSIPLTFAEDIEFEYTIDLRNVMDSLMNTISWESYISINSDLTVYVRPINYKQMAETAIQSFETQKIIQMVNDEKVADEDKLKIFKESFSKLSSVTIGMISASIYKIESSNGPTDNPEFIKEFINNVDKDVFNKIQKHLEDLKERNSVKPMVIPVTDEMREKGMTGETVEIPLVFDVSTFFV